MRLDEKLIQEIELLNLFKLDNPQEGLKVHSDASPERVAAVKRLYQKDMTTLVDGGYLTPLGIQAAEHAHALLQLLRHSG